MMLVGILDVILIFNGNVPSAGFWTEIHIFYPVKVVSMYSNFIDYFHQEWLLSF